MKLELSSAPGFSRVCHRQGCVKSGASRNTFREFASRTAFVLPLVVKRSMKIKGSTGRGQRSEAVHGGFRARNEFRAPADGMRGRHWNPGFRTESSRLSRINAYLPRITYRENEKAEAVPGVRRGPGRRAAHMAFGRVPKGWSLLTSAATFKTGGAAHVPI